MARMTEEELAAKSARNRKAKAETWGLPVAITKTPLRISARERLDGAQTVDIFVPSNEKADLVAHVSKTGKVGKFKPIIPTEHQEQCAVIAWCDQHPIAKHIFAIPNGANKSPATAAKFKREGLRRGIPDLFLPVASRGFHGLFIEMKRVKGSVQADAQLQKAVELEDLGYHVETCRGAQTAIDLIRWYLTKE